MIVPVRVLSMHEIKVSNLLLEIIVISYLKLYKWVQIVRACEYPMRLQGAEEKYGIIFKTFYFSLISPIFEKKKKTTKKKQTNKLINLNFHDWLKHIFIKIQPSTREQEKKRQIIYDLLNDESQSKFLCLP